MTQVRGTPGSASWGPTVLEAGCRTEHFVNDLNFMLNHCQAEGLKSCGETCVPRLEPDVLLLTAVC